MRVYIGIDWSEKSHAIAVLNEKGAQISKETIAHSQDGFARLEALRQQVGAQPQECFVGLETVHTLLIDWLWSHAYTQVYVIPPNVTRSRQASYRQSGARTDESDAYLIANLLRTDRHLLQPWRPDSALTQQLRAKVRLRQRLVKDKVRYQNQLRQVLRRYYPAALEVFGLDSYIGLAFIQRYPLPAQARSLSYEQFQAFVAEHRYPAMHIAAAYARLQRPQPQATAETEAAYTDEAVLLASLLHKSLQVLHQVEGLIKEDFARHPDAAIFASLPGVGDALAPALLVKFGDDRQRFAAPSSVQALAGTCPVTEQSGQRKSVRFRRACDREFRTIAQLWAKASVTKSPWASAYFSDARARGLSTNHAYRALANRWLAILWKLWQTRQPYDPAYHLQQVHKLGLSRR